ncbi:MAG: SDR family mycofactocin-dependent oxidoreductase [Solirubrobacterales bacterium]|nr:SDR family mycofactocin-dependent oxidoreductase [Solirubrobacterales bacterium]MBV9806300.1 SDR family mycofactocin-dependent oxidoreductase [Solirubrobacterales bacterium]
MPDESDLAVVTGAARGIGAAVCTGLATRGWSLLLVDACAAQPGIAYEMPAPADLDALASRCAEAGAASVEVLQADVGSADFVASLTRALERRTAAAAVAAAGVIAGGAGWETSEDAWASLMNVNLHGTRRLAEATIPGMMQAGGGRFVAIASAAALRAMSQLAAYSAAKAATVGYVRALAGDLAGTGVSANAICPGSTRGVMLAASAEVYDLTGEEEFASQHLIRRLIEPHEIAEAVIWLCGPAASALTGAVLPVDGGLTA